MNKRNLTLDILRGHFLIAILVDHLRYKLPDSVFIYYNGYGNLLVSAAEGFVFISGFLVGVVYKNKALQLGIKKMYILLLKRGFKIYLVSVLLTIFFSIFAITFNYDFKVGDGILYNNFADIVVNALLFKYFYGWADILSLYVPLIVISPLVLHLLFKKKLIYVLTASLILWALSINNKECNYFCISKFELLSWQLLFCLGLIFGFYKEKIISVYNYINKNNLHNVIIICTFLISVIFSFLFSFIYTNNIYNNFYYHFFNKYNVGIGRLITFFIWFYCYYFLVNKYKFQISKYLGWIYLTLGKNSLLSYSIQAFILYFVYFIYFPQNYFFSSVINIICILLLVILIKLLNKLRKNVLKLVNSSIP